MKLIVGLGNPGKEYENTRHNIGFMVIDKVCNSHSLSFKEKSGGLYAECILNNDKVIFLKPQNYMNLSGEVIRKFKEYYNIDNSNIFVIYDDVNFQLSEVKLKKEGSSGGHNGMKNIIENLKTEKIKRLKVGISKNKTSIKKYVLKNFSILEKSKLIKIIELSSTIVEDFMLMDFEKLMSKYNGK